MIWTTNSYGKTNGENDLMRTKFQGCSVATSAMLAMLLLAATPLVAQPAYKAPKGPDGHPNFNGIWQAINTANWDLVDHASGPGLDMITGTLTATPGGIGVVEGGEIPYLPAAREQKKKNFENRLALDPEIRCYLPGVPRANYLPYPFQIFQSPKAIFFAYQYAGAVRNIFLKDPGPAPADSWMGQSWGKWEGDTLVIDVTGQDERTWLDRAGDFHSDALHVVERYTMIGPDVLSYEATLEDPKVFSKAWKIKMPLYRHVEKGARLMEFKCVEYVEDLLYGGLEKKQK
jgi:hypothetical protein